MIVTASSDQSRTVTLRVYFPCHLVGAENEVCATERERGGEGRREPGVRSMDSPHWDGTQSIQGYTDVSSAAHIEPRTFF